jgi:membrane complex biogenesis BtpA family protein
MSTMSELFAVPKPIIAMIHLAALPGSAQGGRSLAEVTAGDEATVACMTHVVEAVQGASGLPLGVNVLMNGSRAALAIAHAAGASFVRIKVLVGAVMTSTGIVTGDPHDVLAFRQRLGAQDIAILADVYDRTSAPLGDMPIEVMADLARRHGGASGLVVAGYSVQDTLGRLRSIRSALPDAPLFVGGGAKPENLASLLELSDGVIVGSAYKTGGRFLDPVDAEKAVQFMKVAVEAREALCAPPT